MTTITLPRADIALVEQDASGRLLPSRDLYRWMRDITERAGGVSGPSTVDLAVSAYEDSGVEEAKAVTQDVRAEFGQVPAQIVTAQEDSQSPDTLVLLAAIQALADRLQALEQGLSA